MNNKFERLTFDEVISLGLISFKIGDQSFPQTFKVKELAEAFRNQILNGQIKLLFEESGIGVEVLKLDNKGWKKGRVRFSVEFCPNEPDIAEILTSNQLEDSKSESPLDDIRQRISKDTQQNNS